MRHATQAVRHLQARMGDSSRGNHTDTVLRMMDIWEGTVKALRQAEEERDQMQERRDAVEAARTRAEQSVEQLRVELTAAQEEVSMLRELQIKSGESFRAAAQDLRNTYAADIETLRGQLREAGIDPAVPAALGAPDEDKAPAQE